MRRGAGVAERGGLENRCTLAGTVGSNPTLSATSPATLKSALESNEKSGPRSSVYQACSQGQDHPRALPPARTRRFGLSKIDACWIRSRGAMRSQQIELAEAGELPIDR